MSLNYNGMYTATDNTNWGKGSGPVGVYGDTSSMNNNNDFWATSQSQGIDQNKGNINNNNNNNNSNYYDGNNSHGHDQKQQQYNNWNQQQLQQPTQQPSYAQIAGGNNWNQPPQQQQQQLQPPQPPQISLGSSLIVPPPTFKKKKGHINSPAIANKVPQQSIIPQNNNNTPNKWSLQFNTPPPSQQKTPQYNNINNNWSQQYNTPTQQQQQQQQQQTQPIKKIATNTTAPSKKIKASESLTSYVQRAFKSVESQEQLKEMQALIKEKISGGHIDIDWDNEPLPTLTKSKLTVNSNEKIWQDDMVPLSLKSKKQQQQEKKRKANQVSTTPFDSPNSQNKRLQRFGVNSNSQFTAGTGSYSAEKFGLKESSSSAYNGGESLELDWDSLTIKGTCTDLEKPYLRLTSAPDPSTVRSEETLKKTLAFLKRRWLEKEDYIYTCEQFRSVRQDLTVQRIKNRFTVEVYETHARLALENADLGQFNQCQTQLFQLYKQPGLASSSISEFYAYRLLYNIYQDNSNDITKTISDIDKEAGNVSKTPHVQHALKVRTAIYNNNYCSYFKLCRDPPNMAIYLLEKITPRIRVQALKMILKAYRPTILLQQIMDLGFRNETDAQEFVDKNKLIWTNPKLKKEIDAKLSSSIQIEAPVVVVHAVDGRW